MEDKKKNTTYVTKKEKNKQLNIKGLFSENFPMLKRFIDKQIDRQIHNTHTVRAPATDILISSVLSKPRI